LFFACVIWTEKIWVRTKIFTQIFSDFLLYQLGAWENLIVRGVHIVIKGWVFVEFSFVGSDTSDDRVFDFHPLASDVGGFVGVTRTCHVVSWVWLHLERFSV
jgi:hypothetical protein